MFKKLISIFLITLFVLAPALASPLMLMGMGPSAVTVGGITDPTSISGLTGWWKADGKVQSNVARQFTAANSEYFTIADNADFSFGDEDFSFCAWIYLDSTTTHRTILEKSVGDGDTTGYEYSFFYNDTSERFKLGVDNNGAASGSVLANTFGAPTTGVWYFVYGYHDSVNNLLGISVNNGTVDTAAYSGGSHDGTNPFEIGRSDKAITAYYTDGRLRNIGVWNKVLSAAEVTSLYNRGAGKTYADTDATEKTSLIAYYDLNEQSGNAIDQVAANDLTDTNTVTNAQGNAAGAAQFTAVNSEYFSKTSNSDLQTGDIDFTVAAWVYIDSTGSFRDVISKSSASFTGEYELGIDAGGEPEFYIFDSMGTFENVALGSNLSTAAWHYIVAWHDNSANALKIQADNGSIASFTLTKTPTTNTEPLTICVLDEGAAYNFWNGRIQNVGFWKKVLSTAEKNYLYNGGRGRTYEQLAYSHAPAGITTNLTSWWNLTETSGTRNDSVTTNHLTDNATVTWNPGLAIKNNLAGNKQSVAYIEDHNTGNSRPLYNDTIANQPLKFNNIQNSKPVLRFDNTNDELNSGIASSTFAPVAEWTTFSVFKPTGTAPTDATGVRFLDTIIDSGDRTGFITRGNFTAGDGDRIYAYSWTSGGEESVSATYTVDTWYHIDCWYDGTNLNIYKNGTAGTANAATNRLAPENLYVGADGKNNAGYFNGDIGEWGTYDHDLTAGNITSLDTYLDGRWAY